MANELKPCPFCGGNDLSSGGDDKFVGYSCKTCQATGPNHYGSRDWNTRPTALVEGLETVKWQVKDFADSWFTVDNELGAQAAAEHYGSLVRELVTRSQAEAIIAAKDKRIEAFIANERELEDYQEMQLGKIEKLEADNAALTARVKELEHDLKSYQEPVINAENEKIDLQFKVIDLKTHLAEASKDMASVYEWLRKPDWSNRNFNIVSWANSRPMFSSFAKAYDDRERAALEVQP